MIHKINRTEDRFHNKVIYKKEWLAYYGKRFKNPAKYQIDLVIGLGITPYRLYCGDKKPLIRSLKLISIAWLLFGLPFVYVGLLFVMIFSILTAFFVNQFLFRKIVLDDLDKISGWVSLILACIGIFSVVKFLI